MKLIPLLVCVAIALALPSCAAMEKKKDCPSGTGKCCAAKKKH